LTYQLKLFIVPAKSPLTWNDLSFATFPLVVVDTTTVSLPLVETSGSDLEGVFDRVLAIGVNFRDGL
jgi:hypothetical protein